MKKGFTLIELLAVIVILAIIALIATPIIFNIIKDARINAAVQSAYGYIEAVNIRLAQDRFTEYELLDNTYNILETDLRAKYNGASPSHGLVTILKNNVTSASLCINGYPIEYENGKARYNKNSKICPVKYKFEEPDGTNMSEICNGGTYKVGLYKIKTVEDLVCFGYLVDNGNNFESSTVMLLSDLDINNKKTYKDADTLASYDINENGTIESIYTELTTEKGFNPIGMDSNKPFAGKFEGYGFNINNLIINRTTDYTGLFAYNTGVIQGLNIYDINVTGKQYVGGLAGYSTGTINGININGSVSGTGTSVGGIVGFLRRNNSNEPAIVSNSLVNMDVYGDNNVGGLVGQTSGTSSYKTTVYGIMEDGSVVSRLGYDGKLLGTYTNATYEGASSSQVEGGSNSLSYDGTIYEMNSMFAYEFILDTYIGGDNDDNGYYFDYNSSGDMIVKSTLREPLEIELEGNGTESSPYIIKNADDWKNATLTVNESDNNVYYELGNDVDFADKTFYPLGSKQNIFTGHLDGKNHIIKNIDIYGLTYAGLIGYNSGTLKGINFENINITSSHDYAGLVGYNTGTIEGINFHNSKINGINNYIGLVGYNTGTIKGLNVNNIIVTGKQYVGGVAGYSTGTINEINISGSVSGTGTSVGGIVGYLRRNNSNEPATVSNSLVNMDVYGDNYVGGLVGQTSGTSSYKTTVYGIIEQGSVKSRLGYSGKLIGSYTYATYKGASSSQVGGGSNSLSYSGTIFDAINLNNLEYYSTILDTTDSDSSGYYFGYNSDSSDIIVKAS